jgi:prophage maintenance system killer protein
MTPLDVADLVVIAEKTLGLDTQAVLGLLDITAAQAALAEAVSAAGDGGDPAPGAAALLGALIRHHPLARGNAQVAVVAATTILALHGWQATLDPPKEARAVLDEVAAGRMSTTDLAAWLAPRISLTHQPSAEEAPMHGWLPGPKRPGKRKGLFQRFSPPARQVVAAAQEEARSLRHNYIGSEHILLGLLREGDGVAAQALQAVGISPETARQEVLEIIGHGQQMPSGHIPFTPRAKKALGLALHESLDLNHLYIGTEHILLGLLREGDGVASQVLTRLGASHGRLQEQVKQLLAAPTVKAAAQAPAPVTAPGIRDYDLRIAQAGREKDTALEARDFDRAAAARDSEVELLAERERLIAQWSAGVDVAALGRDLDQLRDEVRRLQDLLLQHGIEPGRGQDGHPGQRTA